MKIRPVGEQLFPADGKVALHNSVNEPKISFCPQEVFMFETYDSHCRQRLVPPD